MMTPMESMEQELRNIKHEAFKLEARLDIILHDIETAHEDIKKVLEKPCISEGK
jgi:hypothetical protein